MWHQQRKKLQKINAETSSKSCKTHSTTPSGALLNIIQWIIIIISTINASSRKLSFESISNDTRPLHQYQNHCTHSSSLIFIFISISIFVAVVFQFIFSHSFDSMCGFSISEKTGFACNLLVNLFHYLFCACYANVYFSFSLYCRRRCCCCCILFHIQHKPIFNVDELFDLMAIIRVYVCRERARTRVRFPLRFQYIYGCCWNRA